MNWGIIYTKEGVTANAFTDLRNKIIAEVKEDIHAVGENGIENLSKQFELNLQFIPVGSYREVFELVDSGKADGGVVNRLFGVLSESNYKINKTPLIFNPVKLKFAFPNDKKYLPLSNTIDTHIAELKRDPNSVFHSIINSYLTGATFDFNNVKPVGPIELTEIEQAWLEGHKTIHLGVDGDYAPYSFRNSSGKYEGLAVDIIDLIASELDIEIEISTGLSWSEIIEKAKSKHIDAILTVFETNERKTFLDFSNIYLPTPLVISTRDDDDSIEGPEDLAGKNVALIRGYYSSEQVTTDNPDITVKWYDSPVDGLTAVSTGEADCYVGVLGVNDYTARMHGISNLKVAARYNMLLNGQRIGVRNDWPILVTIINKALNAISTQAKINLHQQWIGPSDILENHVRLQQENALNSKETDWVKRHKTIHIGIDPEFAPFEFVDQQGRYQGITSEYLEILSKRLGLKFYVIPNLSWDQTVEAARSGKIDMLPCIDKTEDRESFLSFSKPYLDYHRVIITRTETPLISSLSAADKLKVAVQTASSHHGFLLEKTNITPIPYPTLLKALEAVSEGKVDAMVGNLSSSVYWIRKANLTNLKIAAPATNEVSHLHFGVRKDWFPLISILEKGIASISPQKEKRIREKWVHIEYEPGINPKQIIVYLLTIFAAISVIILGFLGWNYKLKKEISKRTAELENLNQQLLLEIDEREKSKIEKEKLQHQLYQSQKHESLGNLASGIAHDFNNFLSVILGYAEIMKLQYKELPQLKANLTNILDAGQKARTLVQQILTFSRQTNSQPQYINPDEILYETVKLLRHTIPSNIRIVYERSSFDGCFYADPTHVSQVLLNLCTNAYHAMEEQGGVLTLSASEVATVYTQHFEESNLERDKFIMLSISDTGSGIPLELQDKIFKPHFTTKEPGKGTGLGLSIVLDIVKNYGGKIDLDSIEDRGTTFNIYFPKHEQEVDNTPIVPASPIEGKEHLLLVDDEQAVLAMYKELLSLFGYTVTETNNGESALKLFQSQPDRFDLVITDQNMPAMNGIQLAREIQVICPETPVILLSGYNSAIDKSKLADTSIKTVLMKPVGKDELGRVIKKILKQT